MSRPDEGLIHTWLDGELDAAEAARVEALVKSDPEWATAAAEARGLIAASSRIVGALDDVPANVVPAKVVQQRWVNQAKGPRAHMLDRPSAADHVIPLVEKILKYKTSAAIGGLAAAAMLLILTKVSPPTPPAKIGVGTAVIAATKAAPPTVPSDEQARAKQSRAAEPSVVEADSRRGNVLSDAAGKAGAQERAASTLPQVVQIQQQAPQQVTSQLQAQTQLRQQTSGAGAAAPTLARVDAAEQRKLQADSLGLLKKEDEKQKAAPAAPTATGLAGAARDARDAGRTGNRVLPETKAIVNEAARLGADSRRAFATEEFTASAPQACYREPATGGTPGIVHRVVRASDTTAVAPSAVAAASAPRPPAVGGAAANAQVAARSRDAALSVTTYRLKGDTLFVPLATGETRLAIKAPCP